LKEGKISDDLNYANLIDLIFATNPGKAQLSGIDGENYIIDSVQASERAFSANLLCGTTFEKAISLGYYVNTRDFVSSSAIPLMSCLVIAHWAKKFFSDNHLARLLNDLFRVDATRPNCYTYEEFHATWEAIRYYSFVQFINLKESKSQDRILLRISDLYNELGQQGILNDRKVYVEKKSQNFL
jgi:hypothetical protein